MDFSEARREGVGVLRLSGRLDASTAGTLAARLCDAIDAGERRFIVDATRLDYIASAGLQTPLAAAKRLGPLAGRIVLSALGEPIRRIFDIAGLSMLFDVNCTAWHSNQGTGCATETQAIPETKSKCKCDDTFQVPVIVESPSGAVIKKAI